LRLIIEGGAISTCNSGFVEEEIKQRRLPSNKTGVSLNHLGCISDFGIFSSVNKYNNLTF
jgi:hypothetical protein